MVADIWEEDVVAVEEAEAATEEAVVVDTWEVEGAGPILAEDSMTVVEAMILRRPSRFPVTRSVSSWGREARPFPPSVGTAELTVRWTRTLLRVRGRRISLSKVHLRPLRELSK